MFQSLEVDTDRGASVWADDDFEVAMYSLSVLTNDFRYRVHSSVGEMVFKTSGLRPSVPVIGSPVT